MRSILAIGNDEDLLITRAAVLKRAKAEVTSVLAEGAIRSLHERRFDLLVLCHTIAADKAKEIIEVARKSNSRVLRIVVRAGERDVASGQSNDDEVLAEPRELVAKVSEILGT